MGSVVRKILCPYHAEKTASGMLYTDHFYCYGCGIYKWLDEFVAENPQYAAGVTAPLKTKYEWGSRSVRASDRAPLVLHTKKTEEDMQVVDECVFPLGEEHVRYLYSRVVDNDFLHRLRGDKTVGVALARDNKIAFKNYWEQQLMFIEYRRITDTDRMKAWYPAGAKTEAPMFAQYVRDKHQAQDQGLQCSVYLTEGTWDALNLWAYGLPAVSLNGGMKFGENMYRYIAGYDEYVIALDSDIGGMKGTHRVLGTLRDKGVRVSIMTSSKGHDFGERMSQDDMDRSTDAIRLVDVEEELYALSKEIRSIP